MPKRLRSPKLLCLCMLGAALCAQQKNAEPAKAAVCEIVKNPQAFDGKLLEVHAVVESGIEDLPAGLTDDSCAAELKFFMPDDARFARLVKSKEFRKLTKELLRNPIVEATVIGWFKVLGTSQKPVPALALEEVRDIVVKPLPKYRGN